MSAVSEPLGYTGTIDLTSEFQKRMVLFDLNKLYWLKMQEGVPDYILIDFIDERYAVARIGNRYFTLSDEFKSGVFINGYKNTIKERVKDE